MEKQKVRYGIFEDLYDVPNGYHTVVLSPMALQSQTYVDKEEFDLERGELHPESIIYYEGYVFENAEIVMEVWKEKVEKI